MKDVRDRRDDEERENGTNGDDRKGRTAIISRVRWHMLINPFCESTVSMDSPIPAHDELDTAE